MMNAIEIVFSIYGIIAIALVLIILKKIDIDNKRIKKRMLKEVKYGEWQEVKRWECSTHNRFEMIEKYRELLKQGTNIETSQEEMQVIDNILFRFWQMDWLDKIDFADAIVRCKDCKYCEKAEEKYEGDRFEPTDIVCTVNNVYTYSNGFCSYGERRAE